jgi:hypothetical protein
MMHARPCFTPLLALLICAAGLMLVACGSRSAAPASAPPAVGRPALAAPPSALAPPARRVSEPGREPQLGAAPQAQVPGYRFVEELHESEREMLIEGLRALGHLDPGSGAESGDQSLQIAVRSYRVSRNQSSEPIVEAPMLEAMEAAIRARAHALSSRTTPLPRPPDAGASPRPPRPLPSIPLPPRPRPDDPAPLASARQGQPAVAVETVRCREPHEALVILVRGPAETVSDEVTVRLTERFVASFDIRQSGSFAGERWCIPRRRACWEAVTFDDWGGRDRAGALRGFASSIVVDERPGAIPSLIERSVLAQCRLEP